jgi:hypothetical protein
LNREPPQARIIAAVQRKSTATSALPEVDAAICIVWDSERCYYWPSTHRYKCHPDAVKFLIATAMKHAAKLELVFDVDGCNTPGTKNLFKTILKIPNDEKRFVFVRTSQLSKLYERHRSKIEFIKRVASAFGLK